MWEPPTESFGGWELPNPASLFKGLEPPCSFSSVPRGLCPACRSQACALRAFCNAQGPPSLKYPAEHELRVGGHGGLWAKTGFF